MKKQVLVLVMFFMVSSSSIFAQGYLKVNPISLAVGIVNLGYEQVTTPKQSVQLKAYSHFSTGLYGGRLMYKFFLSNKPSPAGLYVAPIAAYVGSEGDGIFRVGGLIGYQAIFSNDKLSFEGAIGPAVVPDSETGVLPIFSLNLGIRIGGGHRSK